MPYPKRPYKPNLQPVWGEGPQPCKVMLVGERPGKDEDRLGRPFVGLTGQELERYLFGVGLSRDEVFLTNVVKTYAEGPPTTSEVAEWSPALEGELLESGPLVVGAVGAHAARWFGLDRPLEDAHGVPFLCQRHSTVVVPIVHPDSAFYDPEAGKFVAYDFQMLRALLDGKITVPIDAAPVLAYREETSPQSMFPVLTSLAIDTEGSRKHPWCLTWSNHAGTATLVRRPSCVGQFASDLRVSLDGGSGNLVALHNSLHDLDVLSAMGIELPDDKFVDTMVLAYLLCVEPQGLKALAYRHAGMTMMSYEDVIGPADRNRALEYLYGLAQQDWGPSAPYGKMVKGDFKIKQPWALNKYIDSILRDCEEGKNVNGVYKEPDEIDSRKRWEKIDSTIRAAAEELVGPMPEATLSDVDPAVAANYANRDADATWRILPVLQSRVKQMGLELVSQIDHSIIPMVARMQRTGFPVSIERLHELETKCDIIMAEKIRDIFQMTGWRINPDSGDQVADLLFEELPLMPTKMTKGGKDGKNKRPSTQDKVLESLRDEHPVVPLILDYREASKVRNSFARTIPQDAFVSGSAHRVRCNFRITRVSSGRLAATRPNLLAIPTRSALGKEVRSCFVSPEGRVLAGWDLNQIEMRHMAQESGDANLRAVYYGDGDLHSDTTKRLNTDRPMAKRINFGVITGITGYGLFDQIKLAWADWSAAEKSKWSEERCDAMIETWLTSYPGVRSFFESCKAEARRYSFVRDWAGRIRYLPGVHSPIDRVSAEALRQTHSHKIQAGAQSIMKVGMTAIWKALPRLWADGWYVEPLLQVHDELIFEVDDHPVLFSLLDEIVTSCLTTAHLAYYPEYVVPLSAKGNSANNWGDLK